MMLLESTTIIKEPIVESTKDGFLRLRGVVMQAEATNRNGRVYPKALMQETVRKFCEKGTPCMGELEHPSSLTINLDRVSHLLESLEMEGNDVIGTMKILNTPCGNIVKGLVEGGAEIGASSRGGGDTRKTGQIDEVTNFEFVTLDLVGSPSAYGAYPKAVTESVEDAHESFIQSIHTKENQAMLREMIIKGITGIFK